MRSLWYSMASSRNHFAYLLRMIQENQKKTTSEWNALIRAALMEIDQHIGEASVSERNAVLTFEEYRNKLQNLGAMRGFNMERIDSSASDNRRTRTTSKPESKR